MTHCLTSDSAETRDYHHFSTSQGVCEKRSCSNRVVLGPSSREFHANPATQANSSAFSFTSSSYLFFSTRQRDLWGTDRMVTAVQFAERLNKILADWGTAPIPHARYLKGISRVAARVVPPVQICLYILRHVQVLMCRCVTTHHSKCPPVMGPITCDRSKCVHCGRCAAVCPYNAMTMNDIGCLLFYARPLLLLDSGDYFFMAFVLLISYSLTLSSHPLFPDFLNNTLRECHHSVVE